MFGLLSLFFLSYQKISSISNSASNSCSNISANCEIENYPFSIGEELVYETSYNWGFIWLNAGQVIFKVEQNDFKGTPCYKLSGNGGTYPSYDWIYKVRDRYTCWVDTATLKPFRYIRDVQEGGRFFYNECFFNFNKQKVFSVTKEKKNSRLDTVPIVPCSFDPLSMIYFSRTIDYSKYKPNDTIQIGRASCRERV